MCKYAVVLAGGYGKRLLPLTEDVPKPMLPLGDSTVLQLMLGRLEKAGFDTVSVATHYKAAQVEAVRARGLHLSFFRESVPLGTAGCVKNAAAGFDKSFLVLSGDTVSEFDFKSIMEKHRAHGGKVSIVCKRVPFPTEYGTVTVRDGKVERFVEKPSWSLTLTNLVNTGIYVLEPEILSYIGDGEQDFARNLFPALMAAGIDLHCIEETGYWCDIGDVESYYHCCFRHGGKAKNLLFGTAAKAADSAVEASVLFDGAVVESGAAVYESIICANGHIGKNAFVGRGCVIGAGTVIGDGAYIAGGTFLKGGLRVEKGARVMKSIVFGEIRKRYIEGGTISGRYGSYINGELALRLGGALSYTAGGGSAIGVFHDGSAEAAALADSLMCGVRIYGGRAFDLGEGFEALSAFSAVEYRFAYGVTVKVKGGVAGIVICDSDGLPPTHREERAIEAALARPMPTAVSAGEVLHLEGDDAPKFRYAVKLTEVAKSLRGARLYVGEKNPAAEFLYSVATKLGADVDYGTGTDRDVYYVSADGHYAEARFEGGTDCGFWGLLCLAAKGEEGEVALPTLCPGFVEAAVERGGGRPVFYGEAEGRARQAAYRCFWSYDGNALVLKALEKVLASGKSAGELYADTPKKIIESKTIVCDEEQKAETMERLSTQGERGRGGEGVKLSYRKGSVVVVPLNGGGFRLFAEAVSTEAAEEVFALAEKEIGHRP